MSHVTLYTPKAHASSSKASTNAIVEEGEGEPKVNLHPQQLLIGKVFPLKELSKIP